LLRVADEVRKSQHAYEKACRASRELDQQIAQLTEALQQHEAAQAEAQSEIAAAQATMNALRASDAARSAERLTEKNDFVQRAERTSQQLNAAWDRAKAHAEQSSQHAAKSAQRMVASRKRVNQQSAQAATLAAPDALVRNHHEQISSLCGSETIDEQSLAVACDTAAKETRRWQRHAQHLCLANAAIVQQLARLNESQAALNLHEADLQRRREAVHNAADALVKARAALWQNIERWFGEANELMDGATPLAEIEPQWSTWADRPEDNGPIASFVDEAYRRRTATLAAEIAPRIRRVNCSKFASNRFSGSCGRSSQEQSCYRIVLCYETPAAVRAAAERPFGGSSISLPRFLGQNMQAGKPRSNRVACSTPGCIRTAGWKPLIMTRC
jgi:hypothetical protein